MGRVWPRHEQRGRPLNAIVRTHAMSEPRRLVSAVGWKLSFGLTLLCGAGIMFLVPRLFTFEIAGVVFPVYLVATIIVVVAFVWSSLAISCPNCGLRLFMRQAAAWLAAQRDR